MRFLFFLKISVTKWRKNVPNILHHQNKKDYINDRNDEESEYYKNAIWYKLENKKYTATSELGWTLEITSIDITDDTITFNYNTKGLIGEDALILMRKNNGEFNYFYPEKTEIKDLENTTQNGSNTGYTNNNDYDSGLFEAVETENTVDDEEAFDETENEFTLEQYNDLFDSAKINIENIKTYGSQMDKNTASISGIKIGSTIDEVHNIMKEKAQETYGEKNSLVEYYSDDINVVYQMKNNNYYVTSISTRGRLKTNKQIKIGDNLRKVVESYTKNNKLSKINKNTYNDGLVLYGNDDAVNLKDLDGYVINGSSGKKHIICWIAITLALLNKIIM